MYCCITGVAPAEPVISRLSGALYDRKVIEAYIAQHHRDPQTNEPLSVADLMPVRGGPATSASAAMATSIPGLLHQLHSEWDAVMLEQFSLRQQLAAAQQELSHALFKHDAACRVIARLVVERDEARRAAGIAVEGERTAAAGDANPQARGDKTDTAAVGNGLPDSVVAEISAHHERLRASRKRREISREVPFAPDFDFYTETADLVPAHTSAAGVAAGITCVAATDISGAPTVFSGGSDGKAMCFDVNRQTTVGALIGHQGAIRDIETALDFVVTCGDDGTSRVWRCEVGNYRCSMALKAHQGVVTGISILPTHHQILSTGSDGLLHFQDIEAGVVVGSGKSADSTFGLSTVALHPDGMIAATGAASVVHLWDIRSLEVDITMPLPPKFGNLTTVSFSGNGWCMALGTSAGVVQIFDLRRGTETPLDTLIFDDHNASRTGPQIVSEVAFDPSGQYLAIAASDLKIYHVTDTTCQSLNAFTAHMLPVAGVAWGTNAKWLASGSADRHVKIWAPAGRR